MNQKAGHKIILSVFSDLSTDQRVLKTAEVLKCEGYAVELIGRKLPRSLPLDVTVKPIVSVYFLQEVLLLMLSGTFVYFGICSDAKQIYSWRMI
jgi:hypothetical protein